MSKLMKDIMFEITWLFSPIILALIVIVTPFHTLETLITLISFSFLWSLVPTLKLLKGKKKGNVT